MGYTLLDPQAPTDRSHRSVLCALAVMAKAPRPGKVKTRLSPPLTLEETAALNICFLKDTVETIRRVEGAAALICYTPVGDEAAFDGLLPPEFSLIPQRMGDFGQRLHAAAIDILACGYGSVCLIDSDSPTVPAEAFRTAVAELRRPGDRVVLGPSHDGGYYLIGLKQAHAAPFERITWSTGCVAEETRERCREAGLEVIELPLWYDVDDAATLALLQEELLRGQRPEFAGVRGGDAPHTRRYLEQRAEREIQPATAGQGMTSA